MASIITQPNGRRVIQFRGPDDKRRSIRLGIVEDSLVAEVKVHVEHLAICWEKQTPPSKQTNEWVSQLLADPLRVWIHDKLAAVGLVLERERPEEEEKPCQNSLKLGLFLDWYFEHRSDVKGSTQINWSHAKRNLLEFFGRDKRLTEVTIADAKDFERYLRSSAREMRYGDADKAEGLKPATLAKRIANTKQFFQDAVERGLIPANPFAKLKSTQKANRSRDFFVTRAMTEAVLEACPNVQWRVIVALSRFGGLRCPSEHLALRLTDVDWARDRMTVRSPKTEHHQGGASRVVPIFPELRPYLLAAVEEAPDGTEFVVTKCRDAKTNLRQQFERIIRRAGLEPWPKLFQNLRSSCETELMQRFPAHVVVAWIGHTERIAQKHYLQVTDDDFRAAVEAVQESGANAQVGRRLRQGRAVHAVDVRKRENPDEITSCANSSGFNQWALLDSNQ